MTSEFNELLQGSAGNESDDTVQIWIVGRHDRVLHTMNEFYVRKIATDRAQFSPLVPAPFDRNKYMTVLVR